MIEINLSSERKSFEVPKILGLDLGAIPWVGLIICYVLLYTVETIVIGKLLAEIEADEEAKVLALRTESKQIQKDINKDKGIKQQLDAFYAQVEKLKQREVQVDKIIKQRTNPMQLLVHIARNIPEDLWIDQIVLKDNRLILEGGSFSFQSIGRFRTAVNNAIFFGGSLKLDSTSTKEVSEGSVKRRVEVFKISGTVARYD